MRAYDATFTTAWYAVSLVPRNIVAGQAGKQLLLGPGTYLLFYSVAFLLTPVIRVLLINDAREATLPIPFLRRVGEWILLIVGVMVTGVVVVPVLLPLFDYFVAVARSLVSSQPLALIALGAPVAVGLLMGHMSVGAG